ncbi:MAG: hypothetical protein EXS69_02520 [Candidatus Zambryskibacteria bacterium]|nr:hypothetical protein [Candidatus Zambryskibacteria bacterium]
MVNKNLLLPREKYAEVSQQYGPSPFTFEIKNEKQVLFYFAANHSHDSNNHQYPILREYWDRFLKATEGKEKVVLVEGGVRRIEKDEEVAVRRGSEGSLITFLANKANVPVISPDPSLEKLAEQFPDVSKEEVLLMRFINKVDSFQRHSLSGTFEDVMEDWCKQRRGMETWKDIDISLPNMEEIYKRVLGKDFDLKDNMNQLADPNKTGTRMNEVATLLTDAREISIVSEIERCWKEGKSIFAIFGSGHLIAQRPALEKLLI